MIWNGSLHLATEVYHNICLEGMMKTSESLISTADVAAEMRTEHEEMLLAFFRKRPFQNRPEHRPSTLRIRVVFLKIMYTVN
jgi:hypothetical protein